MARNDEAKTTAGGNGAEPPDPEVTARPTRRRYTAEYKRRILEEADACTKLGEVGALLRREGLYSSLLTTWRRQREKGTLAGLRPRKRGRKGKATTPEARRIAELERKVKRIEQEKRRLEAKLKRADLLLGIQKKVSDLFGIPLSPPPNGESSS